MATRTAAVGSLIDRLRLRQVDLPLLLTTLLLVGAGLAALYSATYQWLPAVFRRQLVWLAVGAVGAVVLAAIPPRVWMRFAKPLYALNVLMLLGVLAFGAERKGAQRWLELPGGFQLQPSEFAKLLLILTLASWLTRQGATIRTPKGFLLSALHMAVPALLVFKQPDLGTSIVFAALWFAMVYLAGAQARWLWLTVVAGALGFAGLWHFDILRDYQKARLASFMNPEADPRESGYHILQARIAVGSGQLTGKGYLHGAQKNLRYIPEQQTDFIFVVVAEELGFVGAVGLLGLFGAFLYSVWRLMVGARDEFHRLLAGGVLTLFTFHLLTNIGMTIGLFPVVGIPLPFISYGGSMLIASLAAVGLLLAVRLHESPVRL
ncbi:MAG: rod shape-determining protein RodA [Fimbriimonadales bacterium]|nr:MAG: rod shape-determining protein RodA [Fimbriimonadales bacterium]